MWGLTVGQIVENKQFGESWSCGDRRWPKQGPEGFSVDHWRSLYKEIWHHSQDNPATVFQTPEQQQMQSIDWGNATGGQYNILGERYEGLN